MATQTIIYFAFAFAKNVEKKHPNSLECWTYIHVLDCNLCVHKKPLPGAHKQT